MKGQHHALAALPSGKAFSYPLIRRLGDPQSQSGHFGENNILQPLVGIQTLGCPADSLLAILPMLSRLALVHMDFMIHSTDPKFSHKIYSTSKKGKAIPLQAWIGSEGPRRLRLPDFKTVSI